MTRSDTGGDIDAQIGQYREQHHGPDHDPDHDGDDRGSDRMCALPSRVRLSAQSCTAVSSHNAIWMASAINQLWDSVASREGRNSTSFGSDWHASTIKGCRERSGVDRVYRGIFVP